MKETYKLDIDSIDTIVNKIKSIVDDKNFVILLRGDLAAGKTTFVKNYVKSININESVTSPTFSIQTVYENDIYHYDLYNKTLENFVSLGLLEEFEKDGIHFVEWGDDKLEEILVSYGFEVLNLKIEKYENKRQYTIYA